MTPLKTLLAPVLGVVASCATTHYAQTYDLSTRSFLSAQDSGGLTHLAAADAARQVTHVFEARGFALADSQVDAPNGELLLRFTRTVPMVAGIYQGAVFYDYPGSVFYVWVTPVASASSTIALIGKPTFDGVEPCTSDRIGQPCQLVEGESLSADKRDFAAREAEIAHGVMSELSVNGVIVGPLPTIPPVLASHRDPAPAVPLPSTPVGQT
jgi:hypothetical protein